MVTQHDEDRHTDNEEHTMQTTTLVQATAQIVTITSLKAGDVYKRLQENSYGEKYTMLFGVVQDVMHNGEDAVISAIEFESDYSGTEAKLKTFGTSADLKLFATTPDEVRVHFASLEENANRAVETAARELSKKQDILYRVQNIARSGDVELTAPATSTPEIEG